MANNETKRKRIKIFLLIVFAFFYLTAIIFLFIGVYLIPKINGALTQTVVVDYEKISQAKEVSALAIRDEEVFYALVDGTTSYYCKEGTKTRLGTKILDIYTQNGGISSSCCLTTGFISYYMDGYEDYYTVDSIPDLEPSYIRQTMIAPSDAHEQECLIGDPLYKQIKSDEWYLVIAEDLENKELYEQTKKLTIAFPKNENQSVEISANLKSIYEKEEGLLIVVSIRNYYEDFAKLRFVKVKIMTNDYEGLIIPKTAVTTQDGFKGVYKLSIDGSYKFTQIDILTENGEDYLITPDSFSQKQIDGTEKNINTLHIYDEIIRNAEDYEN